MKSSPACLLLIAPLISQAACLSMHYGLVDDRGRATVEHRRGEETSVVVKERHLELTNEGWSADGFSGRLVHVSTCQVARVDVEVVHQVVNTEWEKDPWIVLVTESLLAGSSAAIAYTCSTGEAACTRLFDRSAANSPNADVDMTGAKLPARAQTYMFGAIAGALALGAIADGLVYGFTTTGRHVETTERTIETAPVLRPCTDPEPVRDQVGSILIEGHDRPFLTDSQGWFKMEGHVARGALYVTVEEATFWYTPTGTGHASN